MISDPDVWFPVNAAIDGVAPFSDSPVERLQYFVYMQRMHVEALKTQAQLLAAVNPEKAPAAAKKYLEAVLPISDETVMREKFRNEMKGRAVGQLKSFGVDGIRIAKPGSAAWKAAEGKVGSDIDPGAEPARGSFAPRRR